MAGAAGAGIFSGSALADPLFQSDDVISVRIDAPFSTLMRGAKRSTAGHPATLTPRGEAAMPIELSPRGKSRRALCRFAPLRVRFNEKPNAASIFKGQKGLKLVTHCQTSSVYQQYVALEYSAYKMLNVLTPDSLKVRMANIQYVDSKSGKVRAEKFGFFIEDTDEAAKRTGKKELDIIGSVAGRLDPVAAARTELFQYMIGNLDWSVRVASQGADCCHNAKLIGPDKTSHTGLIPVPYDFDSSGLVDAVHAAPPDGLKVRSVRTRLYRGFCSRNDTVRAEAARFLQKRSGLMAALETTPGLDEKRKRKARSYMNEFFDTLSNPEKFEKRIIKKCRN